MKKKVRYYLYSYKNVHDKPLPSHLQEDAGVTCKPSKLPTSQSQHKLHLHMLERSPWTCENICESSQEKQNLEQVKLSSADQQESSHTPHEWYALLDPKHALCCSTHNETLEVEMLGRLCCEET